MAFRHFLASLGIELGPVLLFFGGSVFFGFIAGVVALMVATVVSVAYSLLRDGRIPLFSLITSLFVLAFDTAAIVTHDPSWIVLEYGLYYGCFGVFLIGSYFLHKPGLKLFFSTLFCITDRGWCTLSFRWGYFFLVSACASEAVWRLYSYEAWVYFRFSMVFFIIVFGFSQIFLLRKERLPDASPWGLHL